MRDKMTIEETINGLQEMIESKRYIEHSYDGVVDEDVCERAIELLKEQEQKLVCPKCNGQPKGVICGICGQAVKLE